jgi:hypothetical protein
MNSRRIQLEIETPTGATEVVRVAFPAPGGPQPLGTLELGTGGIVVHAEGAADRALAYDAWTEVGGLRVRVRRLDQVDSSIVDNSGWAAPDVLMAAGGRTVRQTLPVEEGAQVVFGRSKAAGATVEVEDAHVSRMHLAIRRRGAGYVAEDLASRWGTLLNAKPLTAPTELKHGDELRIGDAVLTFRYFLEFLLRQQPPGAAVPGPGVQAAGTGTVEKDKAGSGGSAGPGTPAGSGTGKAAEQGRRSTLWTWMVAVIVGVLALALAVAAAWDSMPWARSTVTGKGDSGLKNQTPAGAPAEKAPPAGGDEGSPDGGEKP